MIRNIKVLGLALVAVCAMSAMVASAAQAAPVTTLTNTAGTTVEKADVHGVQVGTHQFVVDESAVTCTVATFKGTVVDGSTYTKVHPTYTGCTAFGFLNATVTTTGCDYEVMATGAGPNVYGGEIKVVCEENKETKKPYEIVISAGGVCEATVGAQTISTGNAAENVTEGAAPGHMHVKLTNTKSEVVTNRTKDGFGCPFKATGVTTGFYTGTTTVKAYSKEPYTTENQVNMTISP